MDVLLFHLRYCHRHHARCLGDTVSAPGATPMATPDRSSSGTDHERPSSIHDGNVNDAPRETIEGASGQPAHRGCARSDQACEAPTWRREHLVAAPCKPQAANPHCCRGDHCVKTTYIQKLLKLVYSYRSGLRSRHIGITLTPRGSQDHRGVRVFRPKRRAVPPT